MRLLRALKGRFARFLVKLARKLESDIPAAPAPAAVQQMSALRQRFAGAPEHWLQAVARKTSLNLPEAQPVDSPRSHTFDDERASAPRPTPNFAASLASGFEPSAAQFPRSGRRLRPTLRFSTPPTTALIVEQSGAAVERSGQSRPSVRFLQDRLRTRNRLRLARAGDQGERPRVAFDVASSQKSEGPQWNCEPAAAEGPQRELQFPSPSFARSEQATRGDDAGFEARRTEPCFQSSAPRLRSVGNWGGSGAPPLRPDPHFPEPVNHWPDLPDLFDEEGLLLPIRDPAEFEAEQKVGKWSA